MESIKKNFYWKISLWGLSVFTIAFSDAALVINSPCDKYSLINSVDAHPQKNLLCVTYTHANLVVLYKIDEKGRVFILQKFENPRANLSEPQHAVFSPDGKYIIVANWTNETLTVYRHHRGEIFYDRPIAVIGFGERLSGYKPHGITIAPSGNLLAMAFGAASDHPKAIALFELKSGGMELACLLEGKELPFGTPKGITFSPDGKCLLVTFSDSNSLVLFDVKDQKIVETPRQIIRGRDTLISRPEDVKISPNGSVCGITNSDKNNITLYRFDKESNRITQFSPTHRIIEKNGDLKFPHGIAFSCDKEFLFVTLFGEVNTTTEGNISWDKETSPGQAKLFVFRRSPTIVW